MRVESNFHETQYSKSKLLSGSFKNINNEAILGQIINVKPTSDSSQKAFIIDNPMEVPLSFVLPVW